MIFLKCFVSEDAAKIINKDCSILFFTQARLVSYIKKKESRNGAL
ncbi:MAG: hypothetical protein ACOCZ4_01340 [Bacteroidota bacterium]